MNKDEMRQFVLAGQLAEHMETTEKIWKIYYDEMIRLLENPDSQPDTSVLEKFIENKNDTFGQELARLFKDAIEFGFTYGGFVLEVEPYGNQ